MPYMDNGLEMPHVIEERRLNFEQFVIAQKAKGSQGMVNAALHSNGHRDSYGPIIFKPGFTRRGQWVLPADKNPRVVVYTKWDEADTYARSLLPILQNNGFFYSKVWVEKITVHITIPYAHSALANPSDIWEDNDRYVIRMRVQ